MFLRYWEFMKKIKKFLYWTSSFIVSSSVISIAISCGNEEDQKYEIESSTTFPLRFASHGDSELRLKLRENHSFEDTKAITNENNEIKRVINEVNKIINKDVLSKNKLVYKTNNKLIPYIDESKSTYKKTFTVKIYGRDVTFKLNSISSALDLGDYGKEGGNESLYASNLNSVDTSVTFIYDAYVNGKKVSNLAGLSGKVKNQSQITNPIGNFDIDFGPEHFVSTNLNFQEPELEQKSFKASIKSASDGDTFEVIANETKSIGGKISVQKGQSYRIRLMGIDTPEKGITKPQGYVKAAPFEYAFALRSSEFAEKVKKQYGNDILVAFVDGKDAFGRVTAEIMFGPEYKYSYNSEILRAGLTLPLANDTWETEFILKNKSSFIYRLYPEMYKAAKYAQENQKGFYKYFDTPDELTTFIWLFKQNNSYDPFYDNVQGKSKISKYVKN